MTVVELRNPPQQTRARARLQQITDATRAAIAEHGYERFTTAHVAELAGCSIGTVYRYVPDRVALLDLVDPDRYVFAEVRELPSIDHTLEGDIDGVLMSRLALALESLRFEWAPTAEVATERRILVDTIAALQQKVVAIDAAAAAS